MLSAASLKVTVGADVNAALAGLGKVQTAIGGFAAGIGKLALAAGAALAGALGLTVKTAADFEQAMANVRSVMSPAEAKAFGGELSKLALTLGKDTSFSAMEAAAGIEELVKAGIPVASILGGAARSALNLAAAGGISVAQAATLAATALNTFKRPAADLPKIVDHLAGSANASAADIGDLQLGLAAVGPAANLVGLSFEDTATALALFSNNGLRGSDAGTSLKTMLLNLQPATKAQTALFKKLGIITKDGANQFFDAQGNAKDLAGISDVLTKSLKGMTKQQQGATLEKLFGADAIRAAAILATEGAGGIRALQEEIGKVSAADVAAERLNTLLGRMEALKGAAETLATTIGTPLLQPLKNLATGATDALNSLTGKVEGFLAETAKLAADQGISQFAAATTLIKDNLAKAFGPETAALFSSFLGAVKTGLEWLIKNGPLAFEWMQSKLPPGLEEVARLLNSIGKQKDLTVQQGNLGLAAARGEAAVAVAPTGRESSGMMLNQQGGLLSPQEALARLGITPAFLTESRGVDALATFFAKRGAGEHGIGGAPVDRSVHMTFNGPVGQSELNQIDTLLEAQGEVSNVAPPDAPGQ